MKLTKYLFLVIAIMLAITAAYMSIFGLTSLLKGNLYAIGTMAILLELAKVLNITYLHEKWKEIKFTHKSFIFLTTIILLVITSSGVFGFLKNSSIETLGLVKQQEIELQQINKKINIIDTLIFNKSKQKKQVDDLTETYKKTSNDVDINNVLNNIKNTAGESNWMIYSLVTNTGKKSKDKDDIIKELSKESKHLQTQIDSIQDIKFQYEMDIITFQSKNITVKQELGPFYSFAQLVYNQEILTTKQLETTINWYIFLLIFIFDPTAVSLLIIFLNLKNKEQINKKLKSNDTLSENKIENTPIEIINKQNEIENNITKDNITNEIVNNIEDKNENNNVEIINEPIKEIEPIINEVQKEENIVNNEIIDNIQSIEDEITTNIYGEDNKITNTKENNIKLDIVKQEIIKTEPTITKEILTNKAPIETDDFSFKNATIKKTDEKIKQPQKFSTWYEVGKNGGVIKHKN